MTRTVNIVLPDGSIQPITDVPDHFTDEQVAKHEGGKLMSLTQDLAKSGQAGAAVGVSGALTMFPKITTGAMGLAGKALGIDSAVEAARKSAAIIQAIEAKANALGGDYTPQTKLGRDTKAGVAGAIQLPLSRNPMSFIVNSLLGATSGVAGQEVTERLGEGPGVIASMIPFATASGLNALKPSFASKDLMKSINRLTPAQRTEIDTGLRLGREAELNPMPWQVAPENTELSQLGRTTARQPEADIIQARLQQQLPRANQGTVRRLTEPDFAPVNDTPLTPLGPQVLRDVTRNVAAERHLPAGHPSGRAVEQQAGYFGQDVMTPVPQQQLLDELNQLSIRIRAGNAKGAPPVPPEVRQRVQELRAILGGTAPWPETPAFQPGVRTFGEAETVRQGMGEPQPGMANPQQGSVLAMKEAVGRYLANSDPNYARAFHRYGLVDDAVSKVRETAQGSAGRSGESLPSEARLSTLPTLAYAGAVNPLWAMIPPIRNIARGVAARNLDKMMSLNSLDEMSAAASKNAQAKWLEHLIRSGLMPIQLGSVDPTGE